MKAIIKWLIAAIKGFFAADTKRDFKRLKDFLSH